MPSVGIMPSTTFKQVIKDFDADPRPNSTSSNIPLRTTRDLSLKGNISEEDSTKAARQAPNLPGQSATWDGPLTPTARDISIQLQLFFRQPSVFFYALLRVISLTAMKVLRLLRSLIFTPQYFINLIILLAVLYQLESVPFVGLLISFSRKKIASFVWGWGIGNLLNFHDTEVRTTGLSNELPILLGFNNTANATWQLAQIGVSLLPIRHIMEAASSALMGAGSVVRVDGTANKAKLAQEIYKLEKMTGSFARVLREIDIDLGHTFNSMSYQFGDSLGYMRDVVTKTESDLTGSTLLGGSTLFALCGCSAARHYYPSAIMSTAGCSSSIFAAVQADCLFYRHTEDTPYANFFCAPSRLLRSYDESGSMHAILEERTAALAKELLQYLALEHSHVMKLRELAKKGEEESSKIGAGFSKVNEAILGKRNLVTTQATRPPSFWDKLLGKEAGVRAYSRQKIIDVILEMETMEKLIWSQSNVFPSFQTAIRILDGLDADFRNLGIQMYNIQNLHANRTKFDIINWKELIQATEQLNLVTGRLQEAENHYREQQLLAEKVWKLQLEKLFPERWI